ncbi:MAG: 23S rRNA pseudouridine synthase [Chloroflexi bacterium]|nr:MAG: 23S rRNA pseudouridine synthase [Chloroflexota bacterium]
MADNEGERLDVFLSRRLPGLSRTSARRIIDEGLAQVEGSLERASYRLHFGEMVRVHSSPTPAAMVAEPIDIPLDIRYEDADVIVLNKPVGLTVHPAPGERNPTLVNALLAYCPDLQAIGDALRPGLVHRLDKDTSGVMMVAKNAPALQNLQDQIRARTVEKHYVAVVAGTPDPLQGRVEAPVGRDRSDPRRMAIVDGGKPSTTEYTLVERFLDTSLLDCHLITGRTHQIRVHMAALGHPIIGDSIYGHPSHLIDRQALHARLLAFDHPTSGLRLRIEVEPPADIEHLIEVLRGSGSVHGADIGGTVGPASVPPPPGEQAQGKRWRKSRHRSRHIR